MARSSERPTKTEDTIGKCDPHEVYDHPAYAMIGYSVVSGGHDTLFGSDIGHGQRIRLRICRAQHKRNLSNDWYHPRQELIEVDMSHTQFAEFITSPNRGNGVPCTLISLNRDMVPAIEKLETKQDMFRREIEEAGRRRLEHMKTQIKKLGELIESGKTPKKELQAIHRELALQAGHLPGSIGFVVEQAEEALEHATTAAKIEIEATINNHINRIGLDAARAIGLVPQQKEIEE